MRDPKIPQHVAIIMDGNGRWAKSRGLVRINGHEKGADTVRSVITESRKLGVKFLTLYTFSTENWGRKKLEVDFLMRLLKKFLKSELNLMLENNIKFVVSGDVERLPTEVQAEITSVKEKTCQNTEMVLNLALSYGGRQEIMRAVRGIVEDVKSDGLDIDDLDQEVFSDYLYTSGMPDPDLMIRTGGDLRLSNFMLWQMAYAEFYFTKTLWPDFGIDEYMKALGQFGSRERRFGLEDGKRVVDNAED